MKIRNIIGAAILLVLAQKGFAQSAKNGKQYTVDGTIVGVPKGTVRLITTDIDSRIEKTIDSGAINNHVFKLKGAIKTAQLVAVVIEPGNYKFDVFLENSPLKITADTLGAKKMRFAAFGFPSVTLLSKVTVTGSKNSDDYAAWQNDAVLKNYESAYTSLAVQLSDVGQSRENQYVVQFKEDSLRVLMNQRRKTMMDEYIGKNSSSVAGALMFYIYYKVIAPATPPVEVMAALSRFTGEAKASVYYQSIEKSVIKARALNAGNMAPDFTLNQKDSTKFTLSSLRGKYVLIDFWASWCVPCRKAIPHWKTVYQQYHPKGLEIVSVANDIKRNEWIKAMDIEKMPWLQVIDEFPGKNMPAKVASQYQTSFIPFYVLLDKEGKILVYSGDEEKIDQKLSEILP